MDITSHRQSARWRRIYVMSEPRHYPHIWAATTLHRRALLLGSAFVQCLRKKQRQKHKLSFLCFVQAYLQGTWTAEFVFRAQMVFLHMALSLVIFYKLRLNTKTCSLLPVQALSLLKACALLIWEEHKSFHNYSWWHRWGCRAQYLFKQPVPMTSHFSRNPHQFGQRGTQQMSSSLGAHSKGHCLVFHVHLQTGLPESCPPLKRQVFLHQLGDKKHSMW